ncbi:hypothetical protein [Streptomyces sp. SID12488]|uniref:hypothetical protein n=1 Tax=Streptomyces sp. SID12488 TaxID=2706040 RepID=UPI0013DAF1B6|nr:hypothetical protein [Streptomyces sp. SID12488]NEA64782.1 hypothetical protein [Streptomyces sp. SID12488]
MTTVRGSFLAARTSRRSSSSRNRSGPAISTTPSTGVPTAVRQTAATTSSEWTGWNPTGAGRTVSPSVDMSAIVSTNSKNWVAWAREYGMPDSLISSSWTCLARK